MGSGGRSSLWRILLPMQRDHHDDEPERCREEERDRERAEIHHGRRAMRPGLAPG
jgi:hypothetical protein